jgi:hypothetical protein
MLPLLNAIFTAFTSNTPLTTAFPGGLHRDQAPEGTAMPYLVSRVADSKVHYAFGGPYRTQTQVRFSAYAIGHDAAGALADTFAGVFDSIVLGLSAGVHTGTTRLNEPIPKLHHHDADGNDVWEWEVGYEFDVLL